MSLPPFEHVVRDHSSFVLRVCRAYLPWHDAEDAAADALVSAMGAYPLLRPDSDVRGWLATIARRKALDVLRRQARQAQPVASLLDDRLHHDREPGDSDLWAAVRALPERQRAAVAYRYVADLDYASIAALTGTSEAAARRSAADGIKSLRRRYPHIEGEAWQ